MNVYMKRVLIGVILGLALSILGFCLWKAYDNKDNGIVDYNKNIEFVYDKEVVTNGEEYIDIYKMLNASKVDTKNLLNLSQNKQNLNVKIIQLIIRTPMQKKPQISKLCMKKFQELKSV